MWKYSLVRKGFASLWTAIPLAPPDSILGLNEAFNADQGKIKVNLGPGTYRDDNNKPWILPSVRKAEEKIFAAH